MLVLALKISRHQHTFRTVSLVWIDGPWLVKWGSSPTLSNKENCSSCGITPGGLWFAPAVWGFSQAARIQVPTCCAFDGSCKVSDRSWIQCATYLIYPLWSFSLHIRDIDISSTTWRAHSHHWTYGTSTACIPGGVLLLQIGCWML